ncbi:hypothetical protein SMACR_03882 [Sordaria macrospora]|uniref:WGS project CABT00000000 data, contig 2.16 n=2 Tax=Sordaria macrospora TaxID=5147 RepID=F7W077_SORMK|nr:uncharacterized protein SMAC_03882 [Sordaria macrospora k-hell]KAA8631167.1 hypothetical protein SMACR_03882 [Sordaria macrospora]KAH7629740.1 hypothetical protein B0T09DRAFT_285552 [Sordaria sp. MPI-SDFR-AT-0083]WPJ66462.1 hypothetical protein SMAC4_03882 [Sordaria macrospora]CCC11176.1 unnamed protein product [Sordaria macrospora k-hell]
MTGMERTREAFHLMTTNKVPKLRRKLQKSVSKSKRTDEPRRVVSDTYSKRKSSKHHITTADISSPITATPPLLPPVTVTPGIREPEWSEYLWHSPPRTPPRPRRYDRNQQPQTQPEPKEDIPNPDSPVRIIPELSHLAISDADRRASMSSGDPSSPVSQGSPRRCAKTPISFIGQLESGNIPRPRNALADEKRSSVAQIAEESRALLESRNSSIFSHARSDPTYSREQLRRQQTTSSSRRAQSQPPISRMNTTRNRQVSVGNGNGHRNSHTGIHNLELAPSALNISPRLSSFTKPPTTPKTPLRPQPSPRSDNGTLVSFDDETVYFKPDFASLHSPSISDFPLPSPTPAPIIQKDLSLQICLDLLTRDLSAHLMPGLRHRQNRNSTGGKKEEKLSTETSALQVWVMIEGYEKLREELLQEGKFGEVDGQQKEAVKAMLETWLSALYKIYDELSEEAFEVRDDNGSECNYSGDEDGYVSE